MSASSIEIDHLLVGLPATGKTTFVAALWHVVKEHNSPGLKLVEFEGDTSYLDEIETQWLQCKPVKRTQTGTAHNIVLKLEDKETGVTSALHLPDLSGEIYSAQFNERRWDRDHQSRVDRTDGVLLFAHPNAIHEPQPIAQLPRFDTSVPTSGEVKWDSDKHATTQVKLVDLLQFMQIHGPAHKVVPVAVIISAWDVVARTTNIDKSPVAFFKERLPLLYQYLSSNEQCLPHRVFGVSAQGNTYDEADALRDVIHHMERIIVIEHDQKDTAARNHDITAPIRWLMKFASGHMS